MNKGKMLIDQS